MNSGAAREDRHATARLAWLPVSLRLESCLRDGADCQQRREHDNLRTGHDPVHVHRGLPADVVSSEHEHAGGLGGPATAAKALPIGNVALAAAPTALHRRDWDDRDAVALVRPPNTRRTVSSSRSASIRC
jgi:hypothetical protein